MKDCYFSQTLNIKSSCIQTRNHGNIGPLSQIAYRTSSQQYFLTWKTCSQLFKELILKWPRGQHYFVSLNQLLLTT